MAQAMTSTKIVIQQSTLIDEITSKAKLLGEDVADYIDKTDIIQHSLSKNRIKANLIKDFISIRTIGLGSLARVHLCKSRVDNLFYAVKALRKADLIANKQFEHVKNEVIIIRKIHHSFVLQLEAVLQDANYLFLVLEFIEGGDLFTLIIQNIQNPTFKLSFESTHFYACEVLSALEYLHSHNIIHRDVNPENIAIDASGHAKLIDFGLAKEISNAAPAKTFCGKTDYMAPELVSGQPYGKSVDWWSFGVIIFEMLFGYPPFRHNKSSKQTYQRIIDLAYKLPPYFIDAVENKQEHAMEVKQLFERIFTRNSAARSKADQIKSLKWFDNVDWDKVNGKEVEPPFIPEITSGSGSAKYFDKFPEDPSIKYGEFTDDDKFEGLFIGF